MKITHLAISRSVSRGRDTYGYNICRLDDRTTGKRYKCNGGGYDMVGTVFGEWLQDVYQAELLKIADRAHNIYTKESGFKSPDDKTKSRLYGMTWDVSEASVILDGACGIEPMIRIAEAIDLEVQREYKKTGRNRGQTLGYYVCEKSTCS